MRTCPILLLALLAVAAPAMADPLPAHAQRVVDYAIGAQRVV